MKFTSHQHHHGSSSSNEKHKKKLTINQHNFLSEMNKILSVTSHRKLLHNSRTASFLLPDDQSPFDKSAYDSKPSPNSMIITPAKKSRRQTQ